MNVVVESKRLVGVWLLLVAATMASVVFSVELPNQTAAVTFVMAVAALKGIFVMWDFMDLRKADPALRVFCGAWAVGVAAMVVVLHSLVVA